jgi:hypothetical protein
MRHRNAVKVNILQTSNIDSRHAFALGVSAFAVGMHTAFRAKAVLDHVLVKRELLTLASGVSSLRLSRGTNHIREPLRWQIEQLQAIAPASVPSTSNLICPQ